MASTAEEIDRIVGTIIGNPDNQLDESHHQIISNMYSQFRTVIKTAIDNKNITSIADLDDSFWLSVLATVMKGVENYSILGTHKKEIVIEVICVVIQHEVELDDEIKTVMVNNVRRLAPSVIDFAIEVSSYVNVDKEGIIRFIRRKLCCCICK